VDLHLHGKRALVTGASLGIGRAIAEELAREGCDVVLVARDADRLRQAADEIGTATNRKIVAAPGDGSRADSIAEVIGAARAALGGIDILVNNASGFGATDDDAGWTKSLDIDVMATVRASRAAIPFIEKAGGGAILNISSISGYRASARTAPYAAVKAAVINYTLSQALMLAPKKIRVNAIAPGSIEFPGGMWEMIKKHNKPMYDAIQASIPWGRLGNAEEVANAVVFAASPRASWITGAMIPVDGGQHKGNL
jgi:3-oxoacyl-[acyl-carrier protein] reductase